MTNPHSLSVFLLFIYFCLLCLSATLICEYTLREAVIIYGNFDGCLKRTHTHTHRLLLLLMQNLLLFFSTLDDDLSITEDDTVYVLHKLKKELLFWLFAYSIVQLIAMVNCWEMSMYIEN